MKQRILNQEQRRRILEKKRKVKHRQLIQRNLILIVGLVWSIFIFKGIANLIVQNNRGQIAGSTPNHQVVTATRAVLNQGNLILVNDSHPIYEYSDKELVTIGSYLKGICKMKSMDIKLQEEAAASLRQMIIDFNKVVGENDLTVISGYRDFNVQEALHYQSLSEAQEDRDIFVARPDRSEHHTGLAVDFGLCYKDGTCKDYDGTGIYSWINENAYKYGFIMRYDEAKKDKTGIGYEPWHFRYVGKAHAKIMKELDLCLEEYIEFIKNYSYDTNPGQGITQNTKGYWIYYVPCEGMMTNIPLPIGKDYSVSGNNQDGFIVTINVITENNGNGNLN